MCLIKSSCKDYVNETSNLIFFYNVIPSFSFFVAQTCCVQICGYIIVIDNIITIIIIVIDLFQLHVQQVDKNVLLDEDLRYSTSPIRAEDSTAF